MAKKHGYQQAVYNAGGITLTDGDETGLFVGADGRLLVDADVTVAGDIEIGAVELKDGTTDTRANVAAQGTVDVGGSLKVGGVYTATKPTLADGQRGDVQLSPKGSITVLPTAQFGSSDSALQMAGNLGDGNNGNGELAVCVWALNGNTYDRLHTNEAVTLLASGARTTTQTSADLVNYNGISALDVILDVTSAGTGSITLTINGKDPASGKYYLLLSGAAVVANSTNRYRIGPTLAAAANSVAQDYLPRTFQIVVTANNANSMTYSVGYNLTRGV